MADIYRAASMGDLETLKACIERGCDMNAMREGKTPIWFAADSGQLEACKFLIEKGAALNVMQMPEGTPLCAAAEKGQFDIVALLLPHCNAQWEFQTLERAISLGFHQIADLMLSSEIGTDISPNHGGSLIVRHNSLPDFTHWQTFILHRRDRLAAMAPRYLEYALVLGVRAGVKGLPMIEFLLKEGSVDVNCRVRVVDNLETPLTAAAEQGGLEVIRFLLEQPGINIALSGGYGWPPFLHLLRNSCSISTPDGLSLLYALSAGSLIYETKIYKSNEAGPFEIVFENALQSSNEDIMRRVIKIVRGAAESKVLPLLVRTHDKQGLDWVLCRRAFLGMGSRSSWSRICEYLQTNEDAGTFELLVEVTETYVGWKIWSPTILMCLHAQSFRFAKQFFYEPHEEDLQQLTAEILRGFNDVAQNEELIEAWDNSGHANVALWNIAHSRRWRADPEFGKILSDARINPNMCDPHPERLMETTKVDHKFIRQTSYDLNITTEASIHLANASRSSNVAYRDYYMQLVLLEQQNKKRETWQRAGAGKSLLTFSAEIGDVELFDAVLRNPGVDINIQDHYKQTPLMYAVARGDTNMLAKLLIRHDIGVNVTDDQRRSALFYAAQGGHQNTVNMLINTNKSYVSIRDMQGRTALDYARQEGHMGIVNMLGSRR